MSAKHLRNISIAKFEAFLDLCHCQENKSKGGHHKKWSRGDLNRPIIYQDHIDPIPEFIVSNNLRVLGYTKKDFFDILEGKKVVTKSVNCFKLENCK